MLRTTGLLICLIALIAGGVALRAASGYTFQDASGLYHAMKIYPPKTAISEVDFSDSSWSTQANGGQMMWTHTSPFADDILQAAGPRVRKQMQKIKHAAQTVPNLVVEIRGTMETCGFDEGEKAYLWVLSADGKVKWFGERKGYGFVTPDGGGLRVLTFDLPVLAFIDQQTLYFVLQAEGEFQVLSSTLSITILLTPEEQIQAAIGELEQIIEVNPNTALADKAEDARNKAVIALYELSKNEPDNQAAVGNIEGAVGDLEAALDDGLLGLDQGLGLMDLLSYVAWQFAVDAIDVAIAAEAEADKIAEAEQARTEGDQLWTDGAYKYAVSKYKDALAKAEALAEAVVQDLETADGELLGMAGFYYNKADDTTVVQVPCEGLPAYAEYIGLLCEVDEAGNLADCFELGSFRADENGNGYLGVGVHGDVSHLYAVVVDADLVSDATQDGGGIQLFAKREMLIVASKVKAYIKSKKMMTSSDSLDSLSGRVYILLDAAIARTKANRRSTVKAQDL